MFVDECMVGRGITAHQLHSCPVFLAFLRIQRQPRQAFQLAREVRELAEGNLAVVVAYGRTCAAASAVGEQCHVSSRCESMNFPVSGEEAELNEMIAAA